jgi:3-dehydroquinate dehydratase-2
VKVLVMNGPNLGTLGRREPDIYGTQTLEDLEGLIRRRAGELGVQVDCLQSNHEGALIDRIEKIDYDALIINPGALAHQSYALADALRACGKPVVEVHISNLYRRERFRHESLTAAAAIGAITGLGLRGYLLALEYLAQPVAH